MDKTKHTALPSIQESETLLNGETPLPSLQEILHDAPPEIQLNDFLHTSTEIREFPIQFLRTTENLLRGKSLPINRGANASTDESVAPDSGNSSKRRATIG
jgi:hypothetical protein